MLGQLSAWWSRFIGVIATKVLRRPAPPPAIRAPQPAPADVAPAPAPAIQPDNRAIRRALAAERRKYERARKKHDKFVTPAGAPLIVHDERPHRDPPAKLPSAPPVELPPSKEKLIIDRHYYSDSDDEVLYEESEFTGEFNFRDTILDQLERYWVYLDRMRKYDLDSYEFYKQVGALLIPFPTFVDHREKVKGPVKLTREEKEKYKQEIKLTPWFKKVRPGFGCVAWGIDPSQERRELHETEVMKKKDAKIKLMVPKFFYFIRYDRPPPNVELRRGGSIYKLTVWWDRPHDPKARTKYGRPTEFPVHIDDEGHLRILRIKAFHEWYWRDWHIPKYYKEWAAEHGLDVQSHLTHLFCDALKWIEYAQYSMVRVHVTKGDLTAIFGVNVAKLGYFFQDRDIVINDRGHRVKIFHTVRAHERQDGTLVKLHFRGAREFDWAGYHVLITVPGFHHVDPAECSFGVIDGHWIGGHPNSWKRKGYITEGEFGATLASAIKRGVGRWNSG